MYCFSGGLNQSENLTSYEGVVALCSSSLPRSSLPDSRPHRVCPPCHVEYLIQPARLVLPLPGFFPSPPLPYLTRSLSATASKRCGALNCLALALTQCQGIPVQLIRLPASVAPLSDLEIHCSQSLIHSPNVWAMHLPILGYAFAHFRMIP